MKDEATRGPGIRMEVVAGEHITSAAKRARALLADHLKDSIAPPMTWVEFQFNGHTIEVGSNDSPDTVVQRYEDACEAASAAYWTPERKAAEAADIRRRQADYDLLVSAFSDVNLEDPEAVLRWMAEFACVADDNRIQHHATATLLQSLRGSGYRAHYNLRASDETEAQWHIRVGREGEVRYVIGQGMDGIERMGSPHPLIVSFATRLGIYREEHDGQ